ncbi:ABC transporter ATP-binding protein [Mycobacterium sp. C31M]
MTSAAHPRSGGAEVRAQGWGWQHAGRSRPAVHDLDLSIEPGERVLLLGASGSGKSTLLQGLAGLLGGAEEGLLTGRLTVDGADPARQRSRIGMVLQDPDSQVILSNVGDDVAFGMENFAVPRQAIWPRVDRALRSVGLDLPRSRETSKLSGGQKQRLALAGVLAMNPALLLLDEPTANLDPAGAVEVRDALTAVADSTGATVVIVEHRTEVWLPFIDRVIILSADGIIADGPPHGVFSDAAQHLSQSGIWVPGAPVPHPKRTVPAAGDPLLSAAGLSVGYRPDHIVARDLDINLSPGRITAVTGPNGAGKSALALTLGGLIPPRAGTLRARADFSPSPRRREPIRWRSAELVSRIANVFQDPEHQFLTGTVRDEVRLGPKGPDGALARRADELLERLRLAHLADHNPYTLSGGEKRRLSVAAALVTKPGLVVLDEPTFGQDRRTWAELIELLAEIADGGTAVVTVTHDTEFVELLTDGRVELRG